VDVRVGEGVEVYIGRGVGEDIGVSVFMVGSKIVGVFDGTLVVVAIVGIMEVGACVG